MRTSNIIRFGTAAVLAAMLLASGRSPAGDRLKPDFESKYSQARRMLERWDLAGADRLSHELLALADQPGAPGDSALRARLFRASYYYYLGDYPEVVAQIERSKEKLGPDETLPRLYERAKQLAEVWKGARETRSEHFVVRYIPGKDEVLVEPALETLEAAYKALTADLGVVPDAPVLVEIYPSFEGFQAATNLREEDLEKSGTIAVCKYRRLMINTPRSLFYGYNYRDTLSHEFVHFLIYQRYAEAVPIWLHEGLAKYEEDRWRKDHGGDLDPAMASLLASALRQNELISFDRMSPSFAYLETPSQGQLAFAEVTCVVAYLIERGGWDMIFRLCDELAADPDYRKAILATTGVSFDQFWKDAVAYMKSRNFKEVPGIEISAMEIRKGDESFDQVDEDVDESDLESGDEWRYARLGDLLRDRKHFSAAQAEYAKARDAVPYSPRVLNKIGLCYFLSGDFKDGIEPLQEVLSIYPGNVNTSINLGRIYFEMGEMDEAEELFRGSLDVNPFNPIPYNYLAKIYQARGERDKFERIDRDGRIIMGMTPKVQYQSIPEEAPGTATEKGNTSEH